MSRKMVCILLFVIGLGAFILCTNPYSFHDDVQKTLPPYAAVPDTVVERK